MYTFENFLSKLCLNEFNAFIVKKILTSASLIKENFRWLIKLNKRIHVQGYGLTWEALSTSTICRTRTSTRSGSAWKVSTQHRLTHRRRSTPYLAWRRRGIIFFLRGKLHLSHYFYTYINYKMREILTGFLRTKPESSTICFLPNRLFFNKTFS